MLENLIKRKKLLTGLAAVGVASLGYLGVMHYNSMSEREQEIKIFDSFDKSVVIKKESYHYANGIKADVIYRKKNNKRSLLLELLDDPHSLLIEDTPKNDPPIGSTYYIELDAENEVKFKEIDTTLEYYEPMFNKSVDASVNVKIHREKVEGVYKEKIEVYTKGSSALQKFIDLHFAEVEWEIFGKMPDIDKLLHTDDLLKELKSL